LFLRKLLSWFGESRSPLERPWTVATGLLAEGKPLVIRYLSDARGTVTCSNFPHLIVVRWQFDHDGSGLPDSGIRERMLRLEQLLEGVLEPRGLAVHTATATGGGVVEWQWYAGGVDA